MCASTFMAIHRHLHLKFEFSRACIDNWIWENREEKLITCFGFYQIDYRREIGASVPG